MTKINRDVFIFSSLLVRDSVGGKIVGKCFRGVGGGGGRRLGPS